MDTVNVCAVTVTYGDRFHLLSKVLDALVKEEVDKVIVVDNSSSEETKKQLVNLQEKQKGLLSVIYMSENTGSSGGFKAGLEAAKECGDTEFIWLLDDDNVPELGALEKLKNFWAESPEPNKESRLCLLSYRDSRPEYKALAKLDSDSIVPVLGAINSFLGFNLISPFSMRGKNKVLGADLKESDIFMDKNHGKLPVAPYGGMFFNELLLDTIGYPDEKYYLYCDDYEFSHRIIKNGGAIILILDSHIADIDVSENKGFESNDMNLHRLYYSTRNLIYFQKSLADNNFFFSLNHWM